YLCIVQNAITSGTIDANRVTIYGSEGYNRIEIDGDKIKVWDSRDPEVYTEMKRGRVHANHGALSVTGFDDREVIIDGVMRGEQVANIQLFNDRNYVEFNGRDMKIRLDEYHPVYVLWDRYKGRYLDLEGILRLDSTSHAEFRYVDIQITRVGTGDVIATLRKGAYKTTDPAVYSWELRIDLQDYFNTVVDYRRIDFYVTVRLENGYDQNLAYFRVNQGEFYG